MKSKLYIAYCVTSGLLIIGIFLIIGISVYKYNYNRSMAKRRAVPYIERNRIMTTIIEILSKSAQISNTKPFLLYGTLLGFVRNKDFICYDFDVDVGIKSEEYNKLREAVFTTIKNYKEFSVEDRSFLGYHTFVILHKETGVNGDVSDFVKVGNNYKRNVPSAYSKYILHERQVTYPLNWIDDLKIVSFKGSNIYIPNQPDKLLSTYYGDNYIIPDHKCNASCDECVKV